MSVKYLHAMLAVAAMLWPAALPAYGPAGHAIAGHAAEALLCERAAVEIASLADGASLAEIGRWADTIRSEPRYADSAPWHYMNIADDGDIAAHGPPPEGNVLSAIARFRARLADTGRTRAERLEALRFLAHFVVDIHQPLHVGRETDRGGNAIDVVHDGETVNLHRFWDSTALDLGRGGVDGYVDALLPLVRRLDAEFGPATPAEWAGESLDLRPWIYSFEPDAPALSAEYVRRAEVLTRMRLAQAARRLAATLNGVFCATR